jgi:hypothetical protein
MGCRVWACLKKSLKIPKYSNSKGAVNAMIDFATVGKYLTSVLGAGTVGGLISGFLSGELTRYRASRETRKKQLNGLLCDLLEIRHTLLGMNELAKAFGSALPQHTDHVTVALPAVIQVLADPAKLNEHYEAAVTELAAIDPLLAFQLRSKSTISTVLNLVSKVALQDPAAVPLAAKVFKTLNDAIPPALDEAVLRVAQELGRTMKRRVSAKLRKPPEMPDAAKELLATLTSAMQIQQAQATEAAATTVLEQPENSAAQRAKTAG